MNQSHYGSICITEILDRLKSKHSAFYKGKNGKIYMNTTIWLNEQVDEYGNIMSAQANPAKDAKDQRFYIGNFKKSESAKPVSDKDLSSIPTDYDLPVHNAPAPTINEPKEKTGMDDLPF